MMFACVWFFIERLTGNSSFRGGDRVLSRYSEDNDRQSWEEREIIPMSSEEVLEWLQNNNEVDVIEELFPDKIVEA